MLSMAIELDLERTGQYFGGEAWDLVYLTSWAGGLEALVLHSLPPWRLYGE